MRKMKLTASQVVDVMRMNINGTAAVTVDLDSDMDGKGKMRTTGNPFAGLGIVKRETLNGIVGYDYSKAVNRVAAKEDKEARDSKPHPWGDMDAKRLFRIHRKTGEGYLTMKVQATTVHGFFKPDGTQVPKAEISVFIPEKTKSSTQQDLDAEVIARDYKLSNIQAIRGMGLEIELLHEVADSGIAATTMLVAPVAPVAPQPVAQPVAAPVIVCQGGTIQSMELE